MIRKIESWEYRQRRHESDDAEQREQELSCEPCRKLLRLEHHMCRTNFPERLQLRQAVGGYGWKRRIADQSFKSLTVLRAMLAPTWKLLQGEPRLTRRSSLLPGP